MHVALINQFYPPAKAPTGRLLQDLARDLVAAGHRVTVIASDAAYGTSGRSERDGQKSALRVIRVGGRKAHGFGMAGKALDYIAFFWSSYRVCSKLNPPPDALVCLTTPPFIGWVGYRLRRSRNIPYLLWCMDLYPEALTAHGLIGPRSMLNPLIKGVSRRERGHACSLVSLGPDMTGLLVNSGASKVSEVPVWSDIEVSSSSAERARALRQARGWGDEEKIVMYSGNMGRAHRISECAALAGKLARSSSRVRVVFCGDGPARAAWEREHGASIEFMNPYDGDDLAAHLLAADVHVVTQEPAWKGVVVPSKFQAACAVGRPVLFAGPDDAAVAQWIKTHDCGWVMAPGDDGAIDRVAEALHDDGELQAKGEKARALAGSLFDRAANSRRIVRLVEELVAP